MRSPVRSFSPDTEAALRLAERSRIAAQRFQEAVAARQDEAIAAGLKAAYWSPDGRFYWIEADDPQAVAKLAELPEDDVRPMPDDWQLEPCVPVLLAEREKRAESPFLRAVGKALLAFPSEFSKYVPFAGSPAAMLLAGSLLGAGSGYLLGTPVSWFAPSWVDKDRAKRLSLLTGLAAGALPGVLAAIANYRTGRGFTEPGPWYEPSMAEQGLLKASADFGVGGFEPAPKSFAVDPFVKTVLFDPQVAPLIDPAQRTAIVGLVETAAQGPAGKQRKIGVGDIARTVAGMGVGHYVGDLVGRALGLVAGAPKDFQDKLKDTGMYAGVLTTILPSAFGIR